MSTTLVENIAKGTTDPRVGRLWPSDDDGDGDGNIDDDVDNDDDVDDKGGCSIALILLTASAGLQIYVSQKVFSLGSH